MKMPIPKLKAILLYFGTYTDNKFLGKVKLMKLFYFLDFMHVKKYGTPVTYDTYVNLEHGPIPTTIKNLIDTAAEDIDSSILSNTITFKKHESSNMCRMIPSREFSKKDEKYFSPNELDILQKVCQRFGTKNTKYVEDKSHEEAPWKETNLLDTISYTLATHDSDCEVDKDEIELALSI